jgi:hypothetical protein
MTTTSGAASSYLSDQIRAELWRRITERLSGGESLVTRHDYYRAFEAAFHDFTGEEPPPSARAYLRRMVDHVHETHPEAHLARGVQNAVKRAFATGIERLAWDVITVEHSGPGAVQRFLRRDRIRDLLDEIQLDPQLIDVLDCVEYGLGVARAPARPAAAVAARPVALPAAPAGVEAGPPPVHSDAEPEVQVFEAMQRIRPEYDGLLKLLIRHAEHVQSNDAGDRTPLTTALLQAGSFLDLAVAAVGGEDPELRRLAAREAPYDLVAPAKLAPIPASGLQERFVDDLRRLRSEQFATRLAAPDAQVGEDVRSLILLLDHLMEPTPFRRKIRLLTAGQALQALTPEIETLYRSTDRLTEARTAAEGLARQRLQAVFVGASQEEETAVKKRLRGSLMAVEQRIVAETEAAADEVLQSLEPEGAAPEGTEAEEAVEEAVEVSEVEASRGALMASVEVRGDGGRRTIPSVILPDPDDSQRMVMAERDESTGELKPQKRRGRLRYVNKRSDGTWMALTG